MTLSTPYAVTNPLRMYPCYQGGFVMPVKLNTIGLSIDGVEHQVLVSAAKKRGVNIGQVIVDILFVVLNENMVDAVLDDQP